MGDTPNPTTTGQQAQQAINQANQATTEFNLNLGETINLLGNVDKTAGDKFGGLIKNLKNMGTNLGELKLGFSELAKGISLGKDEFTKFSNVYFTFAKLASTADFFGQFKNSGAVFSTVRDNMTAMGSNWTDVLGKMTEKLPEALKKIAVNLIENVSKGQEAEMQFVNLMAASGNLGKVFDTSGQIIGNLSARTLEYTNALGNVAKASGLTLKQTLAYSNELEKIPGMMNELIPIMSKEGAEQGRVAGQTSVLAAALKLATGSGQSFAAVTKTLGEAYNNLSSAQGRVEDSGGKGLQLFATMSEISKTLNIQFSQAEGFLSKVAGQFKFVGDNTEGATKVLGRFMNALRDTGLTSQASLDVIQGMVDAVSKLTMGTKAFISARSGGPGGLQGAFQIEQLLRQGKVDQVVQMTEKTLRQQLGGRIYNLQEASQSPQAAAQFMRQRSLVQSGAFGNLTGGDEAKATRLLEALSKGDRGGAAAVIKTGQDALHSVATQGTSLQEQTNTILNNVAVSSEQTAITTQLMANAWSKSNFGGKEFQDAMKEAGRKVETTTSNNKQNGLFNQTAPSDAAFKEAAANTLKDSAGSVIGGIEKAAGGLTKAAHGALDTTGEGLEVIGGIAKKTQEEMAAKKIDQNTPKFPAPSRQTRASDFTSGARPNISPRTALNTANVVQNQNVNVKTQINIGLTDDAKQLITADQTTTSTNTSVVEQMNNAALHGERGPGY